MRTLLAVCLAVGLIGLARADEKRTGTPAEQIKAIESDFKTTMDTANKEIPTAAADKRQELISKAREKFGKLVEEAAALAAAHPDDAAAAQALAFAAAQAKLAPNGMSAKVKDDIKTVLTKSKDKNAQGAAAFVLGTSLLESADRMPPGAGAAQAKEAEELLVRVEKEFADATLNGQKLGQQATDKLYAVRNLAVGKTAPDVEGTDLDGKKVKLSSYRGKVIVLDIWATWCGPCRAMIPHEREMVKKLEKKPFMLLSVSADAKKETLTEFIKGEPMPWTHWWDGQGGKVAEAFKVEFFPNIYVIDAKGVIRHKQIRGEQLEKAVEELVKEAEGGKG